jgi:hypothetical protein
MLRFIGWKHGFNVVHDWFSIDGRVTTQSDTRYFSLLPDTTIQK